MYTIGIDIGGTQLRTGLFNETYELIRKKAVKTANYKTAGEAVESIKQSVSILMEEEGIAECDLKGIGLGAPGPLDPLRGVIISPPNLPGWRDVPVAEMFKTAFSVPVFLNNDANAAAVAEYVLTYGRKVENLVYITVSTGIGTGVIADNRLLSGHNGSAAEFGHTIIRPDGTECGCGNTGCLEAQTSGTGIVKRMRKRLKETAEPSVFRNNPVFTSKEIIEEALRGDPLAENVLSGVQEDLALGITNIVHACNPEKIIFGGGVMQAGQAFLAPAEEKARRMIMPGMKEDLEISITSFGPDLGLYGAASLVDYHLEED